MKKVALHSLWLVALLAGCSPQSDLKNPSPRFRGKSYDKKHYSLFDLTKAGPVLALFLDIDDPEAAREIGRLRQVRDANKGLAVVAIVRAEEEQLYAWCRAEEKAWNFDRTMPIIPDQFGQFIQQFGAKKSREAAVVNKSTEIVAEGDWTSETIAAAVRAKGFTIDLKTLPSPAPGFKF